MSQKPKVLISTPTTGWIHKQVVYSTDKLARDPRYDLRFIRPTHTPFENNLHHIVNDFMAGECDYWLSIDADNPPTRNPLDLIDLDKDIIGLPTPVWHYKGDKPGERPIYFNVYRDAIGEDGYKEWLPQSGLQRVDAIGTGCFIVARRVFEAEGMRKAPFARKCNEDGTVDRGNDISFCERARAHGFEIWAHFDYPCMHFQELNLLEVIKAFQGLGDR